MANQLCNQRIEEYKQLFYLRRPFTLFLCVSNLSFSIVTTTANILVISALWKSSSIPATLKKLFLSLAFSDLAVGAFAQPIFGITSAVMFRMSANGKYDFEFICPHFLTICEFSVFLLASASFLNVIAISVDRLLAISLHLRYQELVTPKRVSIAILSVWLASTVAASIYISLPSNNDVVSVVLECIGLLVATAAYTRIYKAVKYHQNQIHSQSQMSYQRVKEVLREKKSAINCLFVYVIFLACYVPYLCCSILLIVDNLRVSFLVSSHDSLLLVLLNSSINPLVYCWRYREIREIVKRTIRKIFFCSAATAIVVTTLGDSHSADVVVNS